MIRRSLLFLFLMSCCQVISAQTIWLDTTGRVKKVDNASASTTAVNIVHDANTATQQATYRKYFHKKISVTIANLSDGQLHYASYYEALWGGTKFQQVISDLQKIETWLSPSNAAFPSSFPAGLAKLQALADGIKNVETADINTWYTINGSPLSGTAALNVQDPVSNLYKLQLEYHDLFNTFAAALFNASFSTSGNVLATITQREYSQEEEELKGLLDQTRKTGGKPASDLTLADVSQMIDLHQNIYKSDVIKSFQQSDYYLLWLWVRGGELTIHPFELKNRDTASNASFTELTPRHKNISKLEEASRSGEIRNMILFSANTEANKRDIHFYRLGRENMLTLEKPVIGKQEVRVNVHNTLSGEGLSLNVVKKEEHDGSNETIVNIRDAVGLLAQTYNDLSPAGSWINDIISLGFVQKSGTSLAKFPKTARLRDDGQAHKKSEVLAAIKQDAIDSAIFNPHLFALTVEDDDLKGFYNDDVLTHKDEYINNFVTIYQNYWDMAVEARTQFVTDSMVLHLSYINVYESNLPPRSLTLAPIDQKPVYSTTILNTGVVDKNYNIEYEVKSGIKKGDKVDSTLVASFKVKFGTRRRVTVSAGWLVTVPLKSYAMNKYPEPSNGAPAITTERPTSNYTVGLNIYFSPINTLDNTWFHSDECPAKTRWSVYLGFDILHIKDHFYPGISYDMIPGLKLTVGGHLYRHTRYNIRNNVVLRKGDVVGLAGPFAGISIDPSIITKVLNLKNNKND